MTSRAGGGGDWGDEPTANLRLHKAHVIRRPTPAPVEPELRATQELAKLEVDALLADPLITQRGTDAHVAIEIVDEVPGPIASAAINHLAYTSAVTPKLGVKRLPANADLADGSQRLELDSIPAAIPASAVAQGTGGVIAVGPAEVESGPLRKVPPLERVALGTDPMIPIAANPPARPRLAEPAPRAPWADLVIGFGFGVVLLGIAVLAATYAL